MEKEREEKILRLLGLKGTITILRYLDEHNTAQYKHLNELMNVNVLNKRVNQLTKFNLICHHADPKDLRRKWYELTEKGEKILQILENMIRETDEKDEKASSFKIIQTHSEELYNALLSILSSVTGSADYLKEMHKEYCIRMEIHSLQKKKQKIILAITSALPQEIAERYDRIGENLRKIQKNPQFVKDFEKLNNLFHSLDPQAQVNIICETAKMTQKMFSAMQDEISKNTVGSSDPKRMLILGQALRCGEQMSGTIAGSMKKRPPDMRQTTFCINFLLVLLAKLLAISIEKIEVEALYTDIAFCIYHTKPQIEGPIDEAAFAILGEDE